VVVWACGTVGATLRYGLAATWRSGYAAACKAVHTGSIPVVASRLSPHGAEPLRHAKPTTLTPDVRTRSTR
jgi:hypothetical protein